MSKVIARRLAALEAVKKNAPERKLSILATVLEVTTDPALMNTHSEANGYVTFHAATLKAAYVLREQYLVDKRDLIVLTAPVTDAAGHVIEVLDEKHRNLEAAEMTDSQLLNVWTDGVAAGGDLEEIEAFHRVNERQKPAGNEYAGLVISREADDQ